MPSGPYVPSSNISTRSLLRSLEELRDSLSARVEELSQGIERLRGRTADLERALIGDAGSSINAVNIYP